MIVVKNTYGISAALAPHVASPDMIDQISGSSLDRIPKAKKKLTEIEALIRAPLSGTAVRKEKKLRSLSPRSKSKIRKKIISFACIEKKLSFLTLTFCNSVADNQAVKILALFLKNVIKQHPDFQYLWVAEKQSKNLAFLNNIHFHLITNQHWKIDKWWKYWLNLQAKRGIVPRDLNYKPSSAFDVRRINSNNIKGVVNYLTKYVTKNVSQFDCQIWNCSKKISRLYTDFYSGIEFIKDLERLEKAGQLGGELNVYPKDFCNIYTIPLNRVTMNFYNRINEKNKLIYKTKS